VSGGYAHEYRDLTLSPSAADSLFDISQGDASCTNLAVKSSSAAHPRRVLDPAGVAEVELISLNAMFEAAMQIMHDGQSGSIGIAPHVSVPKLPPRSCAIILMPQKRHGQKARSLRGHESGSFQLNGGDGENEVAQC